MAASRLSKRSHIQDIPFGREPDILPDVAYRAVAPIHPLKFSNAAIGAQLQEDGWLIPGTNSLTIERRVCGIPTRF